MNVSEMNVWLNFKQYLCRSIVSRVQMRTRDFLGVSIICLNTDKISSGPLLKIFNFRWFRWGMWVKGLDICKMWQIVSNIKQNMGTWTLKIPLLANFCGNKILFKDAIMIKSGQIQNMRMDLMKSLSEDIKAALCVVLTQVFTTKTHHNKLIWPFVCSCSKSRDSWMPNHHWKSVTVGNSKVTLKIIHRLFFDLSLIFLSCGHNMTFCIFKWLVSRKYSNSLRTVDNMCPVPLQRG